MLEGKRVLVTGAAGFIASNLIDAILENENEVIGLDNMFNGNMENLKDALNSEHFSFYKADIRDFDLLLNIIKDVDVVYHEGAFTSVPQSVLMPQLCNDVNVAGTLNILNAARIRDVKKVVFASSSSVYGESDVLPKSEDLPCRPISPYGVSKLAGESYMVSYYHMYGLDTTSLRYFNVFGPRQKDSPYSGVITIFLSKIFHNENPVIFGDGTQTRDFTYVKDVVDANLRAAISPNAAGRIMNIAAGKPISLNELTNIMIQSSPNKNLEIEYAPPRKGDILHGYGDILLAKELIGYEPQYDAISGFREYLDYYKIHNPDL